MDSLEVLKGALSIIEDEENWCTHSLHKDGKYCALGAINKSLFGCAYRYLITVEQEESYSVVFNSLEEQCRTQYPEYGDCKAEWVPSSIPAIIMVNNEKGHEAIINCFKNTIALEEEKRYGENLEPVKEREDKVVTGV